MNEPTTPTDNPSTIVRLQTSNFLKIGAEGVDIVPNQTIVKLVGKNASGKSSVLLSIFATLQGKSALPAMPIHQGAAKSETEIDFGDFNAALKITPTGTSITVKSKGVAIRSPMDFLKTGSNEILLDLVKFMRLSETAQGRREQRATLERLVGLDMSGLDSEKKRLYDDRTLVNRELEQERNRLNAYPFDATAPEAEVKVSELMGQLKSLQAEWDLVFKEAEAHNENNRVARAALVTVKESAQDGIDLLKDHDKRISELQKELSDLIESRIKITESIASSNKQIDQMESQVATLKDKNLDEGRAKLAELKKPIEDKIKAADEDNTKFRNNKRRREIEVIVKKKSDETDALTTKIEGIDITKSKMLSEAKFPLAGLSFNEDGILLNGLPMEQGSMAQQLKAIAAIGFAFKPKIRVALIQDASLFDSESLKQIADMAEACGGQVWCECVAKLDDKGNAIAEPFTILIEDGGIREAK